MSKTIQIRDVPNSLYAELKRRAALQGLSLSNYVRAELMQVTEQPALPKQLPLKEWLEQVSKRESIDVTAEDIVNAIRSGRDD